MRGSMRAANLLWFSWALGFVFVTDAPQMIKWVGLVWIVGQVARVDGWVLDGVV